MDASSMEISAETLRGKPCLSKNLLGLINSSAIRKEKARGANISRPTYKIAMMMMKHKSGLTSLEKTVEVDEERQIPIH